MVIETALNEEMAAHLGHEKHQKKRGSNTRNGDSKKIVISDDGELELAIPRDRESRFEPQLIKKHQMDDADPKREKCNESVYIGTCGADEGEGAIPEVKSLKQALKSLHNIRHSYEQDKPDYAYHSDTLSKTANHYLGSPLVIDGSGDDNDAQSALLTQVKIATEQDQLTDIKSLYGNAIKLLKHLREPGIIRHVETRREYQLKATQLNYRYIELKEPIFNPHGSMGAAKPWTIAQRLKYAKLPTTGKIRFVPRIGYTPSDPLPRGPNNGYLDKFKNEWDVQLSKLGEKQLGWASRDGKHLNVSLDCKITHK